MNRVPVRRKGYFTPLDGSIYRAAIPGCYSQGKTVPEALANIREAIDLCIEDMESRGEEIPDPNNMLIGSVVVTR